MNKEQQLLLAVALIGGFIAYSFYKNKNEKTSNMFGLEGKKKIKRKKYSCLCASKGGAIYSQDCECVSGDSELGRVITG